MVSRHRSDTPIEPGTATFATPRRASSRRLSTAQILSLLTTAIVLAATAAGIAAAWVALTHAALDRAQDRLDRSVRQLAGVAANNVRTARPRYVGVTHDPALHEVLRRAGTPDTRPDSAVIRRLLQRLQQPADSGLPIELWGADGKRLGYVGDDMADTIGLTPTGEHAPAARHPRPMTADIRAVDSIQLGRLYVVGARTYFWLTIPVLERGRPVGFIAQQRRIARNSQTEQTIRELSGDSVLGFYHNDDGTSWTTFGGVPSAAPLEARALGARTRAAAGPLVFAEQAVEGTPLVLTMAAPRRLVLTPAKQTTRQLAMFGAGLTLAAGTLAWLVGLSVARPLGRLTTAANELAAGDYGTRVPTSGTYEIASLADRFNNMAEQLGESRADLQRSEEELRVAADEAQSASRAKSDFLAAMSHELRTPLNAIGGYTELLEMGVRGPINAEQRRDLERIRVSQQHLLNLIGSVLDLSRVESGRVTYQLENVDVGKLLMGLEPLVRPQATAKQHDLTFVPPAQPLTVRADAEKLRQILLNLVSNAIRHTPSGTRITVTARAVSRELVEILVKDNGPGIPATRRRDVFEPFVQLDRSLTNTADGIGLGLAISRDLARGMGGDLVLATEGDGACFVVRLPAGASADSRFASSH